MQLTIPDEIIGDRGLTEQDLLRELAVALYRHRKITLGHACEMTGMPEVGFQRLLDAQGVDLNYPEETLDADLATLRRGL